MAAAADAPLLAAISLLLAVAPVGVGGRKSTWALMALVALHLNAAVLGPFSWAPPAGPAALLWVATRRFYPAAPAWLGLASLAAGCRAAGVGGQYVAWAELAGCCAAVGLRLLTLGLTMRATSPNMLVVPLLATLIPKYAFDEEKFFAADGPTPQVLQQRKVRRLPAPAAAAVRCGADRAGLTGARLASAGLAGGTGIAALRGGQRELRQAAGLVSRACAARPRFRCLGVTEMCPPPPRPGAQLLGRAVHQRDPGGVLPVPEAPEQRHFELLRAQREQGRLPLPGGRLQAALGRGQLVRGQRPRLRAVRPATGCAGALPSSRHLRMHVDQDGGAPFLSEGFGRCCRYKTFIEEGQREAREQSITLGKLTTKVQSNAARICEMARKEQCSFHMSGTEVRPHSPTAASCCWPPAAGRLLAACWPPIAAEHAGINHTTGDDGLHPAGTVQPGQAAGGQLLWGVSRLVGRHPQSRRLRCPPPPPPPPRRRLIQMHLAVRALPFPWKQVR